MATFKSFKDIINEVNLTGEVNRYLFSGDERKDPVMVRKPVSFVDLGDSKSTRSMPKNVRAFLNGLPTITWKDVFGVDPVKGDEFWKPHKGIFRMNTPQWFKIKLGAKIILVDTEGYDHVRFAAFIKR